MFGLYSEKEGKLFYSIPYDYNFSNDIQVFKDNDYEKFSEAKHAEYKKVYYLEFIQNKKEDALIDLNVCKKYGFQTDKNEENINNLYTRLHDLISGMQVVEI